MRISIERTAFLILVTMLAFAPACGRDDPEFVRTNALTMTVVDNTPLAQTVGKSGNALFDPSEWVIRCVSLNDEGVRTTSSTTLDPETNLFVISDIPQGEDTVCHIVDADDLLISTIGVNDPGALTGARDVFYLTRDVSATILYDSRLPVSVAHSGDFDMGEAEMRADLGGRWNVGCQDVREIVTDEPAEETDCPEEVDGAQLYIHMVVANGAAGETRMGYGIWRSEEAFGVCGATEGLQLLPQAWVLGAGHEAQANGFAWSSPFESLDASSTSGEIMSMIRANDAEGMVSFEEFSSTNLNLCSDEERCTVQYYNFMRDFGRSNPGLKCWPAIIFSYDGERNPIASLWPFEGGLSKPLGRIHFIEAFEYGNETYMRAASNRIREVYSPTELVKCKIKEEFLIAVEIPDFNEDGSEYQDEDDSEIEAQLLGAADDLIFVGTRLEARYHSSIEVASVSGEHDNLCQQDLGVDDEGDEQDFYSDVVLESISAE